MNVELHSPSDTYPANQQSTDANTLPHTLWLTGTEAPRTDWLWLTRHTHAPHEYDDISNTHTHTQVSRGK